MAVGFSWQQLELARAGLFSISMKAEAEPLGGQVLAGHHGARGQRAAVRTPRPGCRFPLSDELSGGRKPCHMGVSRARAMLWRGQLPGPGSSPRDAHMCFKVSWSKWLPWRMELALAVPRSRIVTRAAVK